MSLFEGIGFQNFKVFRDEVYFNFAPITILTGTNNSGKSSVLNGIKLLQENFENIEITLKPQEDINLESIITREIHTHSMLQRYGTLSQFILKDSPINEFTFCFKRKMQSIEDEAEIYFTVQVAENNIKNGIITHVKIKSAESGKVIFEVKDNYSNDLSAKSVPERYSMKLDFNFFLYKTIARIENSIKYFKEVEVITNKLKEINEKIVPESVADQLIRDFNSRYNTRYRLMSIGDTGHLEMHGFYATDPPFVIQISILEKIIIDQANSKGLHDFSILWKENKENENIFCQMLESYYKTNYSEALSKLDRDIFQFLSYVKWLMPYKHYHTDTGINFILQKSAETSGIGLKRFTELFTNHSRDAYQLFVFGMDENLEIKEEYFRTAILENRDFYDKVFKPLLSLLASNFTGSERMMLNDNDNYYINPFDKLQPSVFEKCYSQLIYEIINLAQTSLADLNAIHFLSTNKIHNRRSYSFADPDEITILIKKLETLAPLNKNKAYEFINRWLKKFEIADELNIQFDNDTGDFKPYLKNKSSELLLADFGFGTSKLIPLLLKLIPEEIADSEVFPGDSPFQSRVVVIEEPETNLHPALQSKLADLFVEATKKFNIQIILETHSEYLIRKLQYLTGKGEIDPLVTQLYYFYHPDKIPKDEKQVKKININKDGSLTDNFGTGFFDEADIIALELFLFNQSQNN